MYNDSDPLYNAYKILRDYMNGDETDSDYVIETALGYIVEIMDD